MRVMSASLQQQELPRGSVLSGLQSVEIHSARQIAAIELHLVRPRQLDLVDQRRDLPSEKIVHDELYPQLLWHIILDGRRGIERVWKVLT